MAPRPRPPLKQPGSSPWAQRSVRTSHAALWKCTLLTCLWPLWLLGQRLCVPGGSTVQVFSIYLGRKCVCGEGGDDVYSRQPSPSISSLLAKSCRVHVGKEVCAAHKQTAAWLTVSVLVTVQTHGYVLTSGLHPREQRPQNRPQTGCSRPLGSPAHHSPPPLPSPSFCEEEGPCGQPERKPKRPSRPVQHH